ncbi:fimbrial biogenesis chaperone [Pseudoxanthomonas indica]|uniref:Chaperone protein EcpD n=1 Tax=Pseudoxanthomonas indica TaxID=428993 RepID=A0A1T5K4U2_9GAMM|nr:fimbria/pilus periplasmic chaperone [Pseudoxanthomonas indica]GGD46693.1 fimbrial chaperone [Pseudoxanthomonas indica]SKC58631.1 chaperone protein EcpD [Pseudoxanthomonas indica]
MNSYIRIALTSVFCLSMAPMANAQTQVHGTRVIYPAEEREVTVSVDNVGKTPRLLQVWVDDGKENTTAETATAPFLLTPPMSRVEPGKGQSFRLMFTGGDVPQDRESVFWFNVLEIPPKPEAKDAPANYLQFAVRTRLKIFYRPKGLKDDPLSALDTLTWRLVHDGTSLALECTNPSPYNVSVANVRFKGTELPKDSIEQPSGMCTAKSSHRIVLPGHESGSGTLIYNAINDYGGFVEREAPYTR